MDRLHLRNPSGELATSPREVGKESPYPFVLSLLQDEHERFLTDNPAAGHASNGTRTHRVHPVGRRCGPSLTNGTAATWTGAYLCGCDGARSAVRHVLGVGFPGGTYDQLFYVCDAEAEGSWTTHDINAHLAEKTFCLAFPVRTAGMFRFIGLVPEALTDREDLTFDDLRAGVEKVTGTRVTRVNWFSTYRVHHRVAEHFRQGRVFLAGDAGHVHSPAGGQGMNTGIGDAVNLAWKLAAVLRGRAAPEILDSYEAERLPFARSLVATTDRVFDAVVGRSVLARLVRTVFAPYVLPFALGFPAVRRAQFRLVSQTRIAYREPGERRVRGVHAGDRLPWVEGRQLRPAEVARLAAPSPRHRDGRGAGVRGGREAPGARMGMGRRGPARRSRRGRVVSGTTGWLHRLGPADAGLGGTSGVLGAIRDPLRRAAGLG